MGVGKHRLYYTVANSLVFYKWYIKLSLNKLKKLLNTKEKKTLFIRGFYESEGTIFKTKSKQYVVAIINTDVSLLRLTKTLLGEIGFSFNLGGPYKTIGLGKKPRYYLQTAKQQQVRGFIDTINPIIKRACF